MQTLYKNPAIKLESNIIAGNLKRKEKVLDYSQYLTDAAVLKAQNYLNENQEVLTKAHEKFGVPPSMIVAVLTVETWLGTYTGKYLTINILSTMAVAGNHQIQEKIFSSFKTEMSKTNFQKQVVPVLKQRVEESYRELKFFLNYVKKNHLDPCSIKGSVEGAIGIPQFMPSNIFSYGQDGDGDGRVDLFNHADAIASIASFLSAHNWNQAKGVTERKKVLLHYNRSIYYVDTVFALAERLEQDSSSFYPEKTIGKNKVTPPVQ